MSERARELELIMRETKTSQRRLSILLGMSPVTINRYFVERADRLEVPFYVLAFMRAFLMLSAAQREALHRMNAPKKATAGKPAASKRPAV